MMDNTLIVICQMLQINIIQGSYEWPFVLIGDLAAV